MDPSYRRILLIKPGAVGDLLQLTPTIRALKRKFPAAEIDLMVGSAAAAAMFRHNRSLGGTVVFDRGGEHRSLAGFAALWRRVRSSRYDLVVNFQRRNLKAWLLACAAFPCRILVYRKTTSRQVHAVIDHMAAVAPLGIDPAGEDLALEMPLGPDDERYAAELFRREGLAGKTVIAFNPGASNRIKCWSPARFAGLGNRLAGDPGVAVLVVGGGDEHDLADAIRSGMQSPPLDLVGKTTLPQLGALLKRCALLVSGDTGPLHLATAVGTPVIALFGAIDPERTGPVGGGHRVLRHTEVPCVPCVDRACRNQVPLDCMERITVEEVYGAVREILAGPGGAPLEKGRWKGF